jgi:hypothetical protein
MPTEFTKETLGALAAFISLVGYSLYLVSVLRTRTKPHAISWLTWSALNGVSFSAQIVSHGGPGAWTTGAVCTATFLIFATALFCGERRITTSDWLSLGGAGVAGLLWMVTKGPLLSVILVTIIDAFGSFPTFRKSFRNPFEESPVAYIGGAVAFSLALLALQAYRAETVLFPSFIVLADGSLVIMLVVRRWMLARATA